MKQIITLSISIFLLASCSKSPSQLNAEAEKANLYYPTTYTNGQILLPDYAHNDTLVVINAKRLNQLFNSGEAVGSDEDISDILYEGAIPINKNQNQ